MSSKRPNPAKEEEKVSKKPKIEAPALDNAIPGASYVSGAVNLMKEVASLFYTTSEDKIVKIDPGKGYKTLDFLSEWQECIGVDEV